MSNPTDSQSQGLLELFDPKLTKIEEHINELVEKQRKIHTDMALACQHINEDNVQPNFQMIDEEMKLHKDNLLLIQKQIDQLHRETHSLKKQEIFIKELRSLVMEEKIRQLNQEEENYIASSSDDPVKP